METFADICGALCMGCLTAFILSCTVYWLHAVWQAMRS
jgi:hypothetical protein